MGIFSFFKEHGSVGTTARLILEQFINCDPNKSNIDKMKSIIEIRYSNLPNTSHYNHLITNINEIESEYGLAALIVEILNLEAGLYKNDFEVIDKMCLTIINILNEDNILTDTQKFGVKGAPDLGKSYSFENSVLAMALSAFSTSYVSRN